MKNENFKGTKGEVYVFTEGNGQLWISLHHKEHFIAEVCADDYANPKDVKQTDETRANANLIAEAFNVVNETGYTPRQLAEQNKELLEALKEVSSEYWILCAGNSNDAVLYAKCKAAIKNAEQ